MSGVLARAKGAVRALRAEQLSGMREILERAVALERSTHRYTNRTGAAEESTALVGSISGDRYEIAIVMGVRYARYLVAGGWTDIKQIATDARGEVRDYLRGVRDRIARGQF